MGFIIYFLILFALVYFWNKNSKTADDDGKRLDNKILGWIIIIYIFIGFYQIGTNYDECSPISMTGSQKCINYNE